MTHNLTNLLINMYFALADTLDMLMREIEYRIRVLDRGELKHDVKRAHNLMMQSVQDFHKRYDLYVDKARLDCMKHDGDYDASREDSNNFMRFLLLFADRCDTPEKMNKALQWMKWFPANVAPDEYVDKFTLK